MKFDAKMFSESLLASVKGYVERKFENLSLKVDLFEEKMKNVKDGRDGRDGRDGKDGDKGLDALSLEVLASINTDKSYQRGVYASHRGGLWVSKSETQGMDGWHCIVNGVDDIDITISEDLRTVEVKTLKTNGQEIKKHFSVPSIVYKEIYSSSEEYKKGDCVTYAGSMWVCKEDATKEKPGSEAKHWQLSVKRGKDAKGL